MLYGQTACLLLYVLKEYVKLMRKLSASVLVLTVLLAIFGSAISAFARSSDPFSTYMAHPNLIIVKSSGSVTPGSVPGISPEQFDKAYGLSKLKNQGAGITIAI